MLRSMPRSVRAAIALLLISVCGVVAAQDDQTRYLVSITQLKPDMVDEWLELQQNEVVPALKEAGIASRTTLETMFGNRPEYVTIRPLESFAEFDGQGLLRRVLGEREADALIARLQACEVSSVRFISNRQDEFNVGSTAAPVRITTWYRVNQGAGPLYRAFLREEVIPFQRQAVERGLAVGYTVSINGQGSPEAGIWSQSTYLPNLAALDAQGAAGQILGQGGAQALAARAAQLRETVKTVVRRVVPEASY